MKAITNNDATIAVQMYMHIVVDSASNVKLNDVKFNVTLTTFGSWSIRDSSNLILNSTKFVWIRLWFEHSIHWLLCLTNMKSIYQLNWPEFGRVILKWLGKPAHTVVWLISGNSIAQIHCPVLAMTFLTYSTVDFPRRNRHFPSYWRNFFHGLTLMVHDFGGFLLFH